jgi:anti-sigma-K factor RskA
MNDEPDEPDDRETLAAEHALRLLSGEELRTAAALEADDRDFARQVSRWRGRLAPLLGEVHPVEPPDALWQRIEQATGSGIWNVISLRRSRAVWRGVAAGMTALAAAFGLILLQQPRPSQQPVAIQRPAAPPLVAMLGDTDKKMKVVASWDPASQRLVLAVAGDMPADPRHAHELWVIPANGKPRSLGTMGGGKQMHMRLADALSQLLQQGATIAISVEPPGGSPTGAPTGPVVASGSLDRA